MYKRQVLGRAAFGGLALWAEAHVGAAPVVLALAGLLGFSALLVAGAPDRLAAEDAALAPRRRIAAAGRLLIDALRRPATIFGLAFAALAGAGMEAVGGLAGPMLIDQGLAAEQVGRFLAVAGVAGLGAGSLAGGRLADRVPRTRAAALGVLGVAAACTAVALGIGRVGTAPLLAALFVAYFLFGVLTCATYTLMMDLTEPRVGGAQFSAFMGAVNLCYVWSVAAAGQLVPRVGYSGALLLAASASLFALALLPAIRARSPLESGAQAGG